MYSKKIRNFILTIFDSIKFRAMKEQILALEKLAAPLEATPQERHQLNHAVTTYVDEFINELPISKSYYATSHEGIAIPKRL